MSEQRVQQEAILALAKIPGVRIWRCNTGVGVGWGEFADIKRAVMQGRITDAIKIMSRIRPITFGVKGQADVAGIGPGGVRIEIEMKFGRGKQSDQQKKYQQMIERMGGIYIVAKSADEAVMKLKEKINEREKDLERQIALNEDILRWFEFESGRGSTYLTREDYEDAVSRGDWTPEGDQ